MNKEDAIKEITVGNKILRIFADDDAQSPRQDDNLGKLICFHKRYTLGDKHEYKYEDYNSWEEMQKAINHKEKCAIILPLYIYDHSGITIRTTSFNDRWDSGLIGFAIVTKEAIRKEYSVKRVTKELVEKAEKVLNAEIETYDTFVRGEVYGFEVLEVENGEENSIDSCWGFFGSDFKTNGIVEYLDKELAEALKVA